MKKLAKTVRMVGLDGSTEAAAIDALVAAEGKHGQQMQYLRRWIQGGYLLERLGHGFLQSLIAMSDARMMDGLSEEQQARFIGQMIDRTMWMEKVVETPPAPKVTPEPERVEEFQVKEAPVKPIEDNKQEQTPPPQDDDDDDDFEIHLDIV